MRSSLIGSLIANVRYNLNRKASRIRVFEVAKVYLRDETLADGALAVKGIAQPLRVAALAYGQALDDQWGVPARIVDFFDVKRDLDNLLLPRVAEFQKAEHPALHPGRSARVLLGGRAIGWLGELHPRLLQKYELPEAPVLFEVDAAALLALEMPQLAEIPKFPAVTRDLALVVQSSLPVGQLLSKIASLRASEAPLAIVRDVNLFDEYRGKGLKDNEKSLAFRFTLQDTRQTLSDEQIELAMARIVAALQETFDAHPR
jgi:phenylalanyl-tRNA synthetase beta chain